jgi:transposase-like protein
VEAKVASKVSARGRWRKYEPEFKRQAVDRMLAGESATTVARELGIRCKFLYHWRDQGWGTLAQAAAAETAVEPELAEAAETAGPDREQETLRKKIAALERLVGQQAAELDFFAAALRNIGAPEPRSGVATGGGSIKRWKP